MLRRKEADEICHALGAAACLLGVLMMRFVMSRTMLWLVVDACEVMRR